MVIVKACRHRRPSGQSLAEFSRPQTEKSILMYFFAGSAGEKIPLSPQVCGRCAAVRAGGCYPPIFEAQRSGSKNSLAGLNFLSQTSG